MAKYEPTPLPKRFIGKQLCAKVKRDGSSGGPLTLCIFGHKYGFSGWLYPDPKHPVKNGIDRLPVSIGDARTPEQAMKQARKFLERVATKEN